MKTGLGKRIAYLVLKTFKPTYFNIVISWFIIGLVLSALTPSITVRLSIVMPIAMNLAEACKLADRSRGCALICLAAWAAAVLPGTGWLTGSLWGVFLMGFYPEELKSVVTFGAYFEYMAVPWFIITILFVGLVYIFLKPKQSLDISQETFKDQYSALGKITGQEFITATILIGTLILFSTEKLHHISTPTVALLAFGALMMFKIVTFPEISTGVNWDIINFIAIVVSLIAIFVKSGISGWARPFIRTYRNELRWHSDHVSVICYDRPLVHPIRRYLLGVCHVSPRCSALHSSLSKIRASSSAGQCGNYCRGELLLPCLPATFHHDGGRHVEIPRMELPARSALAERSMQSRLS